jgi:hypothetical protein
MQHAQHMWPTSVHHALLPPSPAQFVEKDPKLAEPVLRQLLKFWPLTNSQKEVLFLGELEEVLELTQPAEFQAVMEPLFRQLARCLTRAHFQVGGRPATATWDLGVGRLPACMMEPPQPASAHLPCLDRP